MGIQLRDGTYYLTTTAGIRHNTESHKCQEHSHDFIEMVYILRGKCVHTIDGKAYPAKKGDLLIINYDQKHSIAGGAGEYINIFLKPEYLSENLAEQSNAFALLDLVEFSDFKKTLAEIKNMISFTGFEKTTVENLLANLENELQKKPAGYEISVRSWFHLLLVMVFRKMSAQLTERFNGITSELLIYIKTHCHEKLEMQDIAAKCNYNPSYFSRIFREFTGVSFTEYLKQMRIEKAALLLANTAMQVLDICYEVGYSDKTKFFCHFKEIHGQTPLAYRKNNVTK